MSFENFNDLTEARRKAVTESIHTVNAEELQALGDRFFPYGDHPWREKLLAFLAENTGATLYHATTNDQIQIIYCPSKNAGLWFMPESGIGVIQPNALAILKEITQGA